MEVEQADPLGATASVVTNSPEKEKSRSFMFGRLFGQESGGAKKA